MLRKFLFVFSFLGLWLFLGISCHPVDRSDEQPFPPTVMTTGCEVQSDSCLLMGEVTASPNSDLKRCGFRYGNDTLRVDLSCEQPTLIFSATTRPLLPGRYYAVAYAANGVGLTIATDTIWFEI